MSETNGYTTAEGIFSVPVRRSYADKTIEGLGKFRLQNLLASDVVSLESKTTSKSGRKTVLAKIIAAHCVDAEGSLVFTDADIPKLMGLPASQVLSLSTACSNHSGIGADDEDEEKN
jgi:hypothetical protein